MNISVPLLTIVPIPYIAIHNIDIDFKLAVSGVEQDSTESGFTVEGQQTRSSETKKGGGWLTKKKVSKMTTSISTKRDSKSTSDSRYSVEATIDVSVHAGQESMPAGMSKILELLGGALDVVSTRGELAFDGPFAASDDLIFIVARYKNPEGIFVTEGLACDNSKRSETNGDGDAVLFYFDKNTKTTKLTAPKIEGVDTPLTRTVDLTI